LNLYYVTFRDIIEWALRAGLRRYVTAPFSYEAKLHLRLEFVPHDLYVRHTSPLLNPMLRRIAPFFGPTRTDPALRKHFRDGRLPAI
ncbi:MAG: GNAT family N-acetyltransferase, partial [Verrucomicrobiota bacterium]|nr:GNAT family N-acetyltransferase [Verrucomicrobiota bacterium]